MKISKYPTCNEVFIDPPGDYGYSWSWQRDKCLARDNYSCQICDKKQKEGYRLCIHHIIPYNEFGSNYGCLGNWPHHKKANRLRNLICLCSSCHGKVHGNNHEKNKKFLQLIANINTEQFLREEKRTFRNNIRKNIRKPQCNFCLKLFPESQIVTLSLGGKICKKCCEDATILFFRDNIESIEVRKKLYPEFKRVAEKTQDRKELLQLFEKYLTEVQES